MQLAQSTLENLQQLGLQTPDSKNLKKKGSTFSPTSGPTHAKNVLASTSVVTPTRAKKVFISSCKETAECSICIDLLPNCALLCCGACFHFQCLQKWLLTNEKVSLV